jgi:hypothetical protein
MGSYGRAAIGDSSKLAVVEFTETLKKYFTDKVEEESLARVDKCLHQHPPQNHLKSR